MISFQDLYYTASLIEYIGRKTQNHRSDVVKAIGINGLQALLESAAVNHCLTFEQVSDVVSEQYGIASGNYDSIAECNYKVPPYKAIGKVYARLIEDLSENNTVDVNTVYQVFTSKVSDMISDFNSAFFFAPRSEILFYYKSL